jgi:hypothetical protein
MAKNNSDDGIFEMESGLVHFVPDEFALQKDRPFATSPLNIKHEKSKMAGQKQLFGLFDQKESK